jgi:hypothetical protein
MNATQLAGQVIVHTPLWVWVLLGFISLLGLRQAKDQVITSGRLIGVSFGWTVLSLIGAASTFGFSAGVLLAWAAGLVLSLALQHGRIAPRGVRALGNGRYAVAGSLWPLLTIWLVFGVRYASSAMVVLDPALKQHAGFGLAVAAIYGLLSSLFVGRALRVLGSGAPRAATLAAA